MIKGKREAQKAFYKIEISDDGSGIPPKEIERITEAFYMVDKSRSRSKNGAGLGLSLCAQVLGLHHSELLIESTVGEGSCFSFVIPDSKEEDHG